MYSTDDTIVAIATPAGRGGIGVVRISGPSAAAVASGLAAARRTTSTASRDVRAHARRPGGGDLLPRSAFLHRRARRRDQRARKPGRASADRRAGDGAGSAACGARRVHASRISQRPNRSRAGRGGRRSDRRRHATAGARGVRSTGRDAHRAHRARSTPSCSISRRSWRRRSIFQTRAITSSRPAKRRRRCARSNAKLGALLCEARRGRLIREGARVAIARQAERRQVEPVQRAVCAPAARS